MKTATLPVEWRKDDLFVGPTPIGWIISAPPNRYRVAFDFEAAAMALGVKDA